jgi:hypothetical protein
MFFMGKSGLSLIQKQTAVCFWDGSKTKLRFSFGIAPHALSGRNRIVAKVKAR